jgi:hypothetical protein
MYVSYMKLEHKKSLWHMQIWKYNLYVQNVYIWQMYHDIKQTNSKQNTIQAQIQILHLIIQ